MATIFEYEGDGATVRFSAPVDYIDVTHIHAYVGEPLVETYAFTYDTVTQEVVFDTPPAAPAVPATDNVRIRRITPSTPLVSLTAPGALTVADLNKAHLQLLYRQEEVEDDGSVDLGTISDSTLTREKLTSGFKDELPRAYDTIADMVADTSLAVGEKIITLGYYSEGDGGGASYAVVAAATGTDDGGAYHDLSNGFQAQLIDSSGYADVAKWGAYTDGISDARAGITAADAYAVANGVGIRFTPGTYKVASNLTITANTTVIEGATLSPSGGVTLTIDGELSSGAYKIFGATGTIEGQLGGAVVLPEWYGAVADGNVSTGAGTDNSSAFNSALLLAANNGRYGVVELGIGIYRVASTVDITTNGTCLRGKSYYSSIIMCASAFSGSVVKLSNAGGPPCFVHSLGVIAQVGGAFSATGIQNQANGSTIKDVWVAGVGTGISLESTDQHLFDFYVELNVTGINVTSTAVNISNGETYFNQSAGITVQNVAANQHAIHINNVRSVTDTQKGFDINTANDVQITGCSFTHNNAGQYSQGGIVLTAASHILIADCTFDLGSLSTTTTQDGIRVVSGTNIIVRDCMFRNFWNGIKHSGSGNTTITGCHFEQCADSGVIASDYNILSVMSCLFNTIGAGVGATVKTGVKVTANRAYQRLLVSNNQGIQYGGGPMVRGIHVTCSDANSYGGVFANQNTFMATAPITVDGANAANITQANNI